MNRRTFLGCLSLTWLNQVTSPGREDLIVTVGAVIVSDTIELDLNPIDGGGLISISLHAITTSSLSETRKAECLKFLQEFLKDKKLKYRYIGTDRSEKLPTVFGDLYLPPNGKNLSEELIQRGFAILIPELKGRRPDLAAIQLKRDRDPSVSSTISYVIPKPADKSLHPSLKSCVTAGDVRIESYASFGTGLKNTIGLLVSNHQNKSGPTWSINLCYRIRKGNTDGHKILVAGATTNQIVFWMFYDPTTKSMIYGNGATSRGSIAPSYKWQILTYTHEKDADEVHIDGKLLLQLPSVSEACDVMITPSAHVQTGENTVTDIQFIDYASTRMVATRSTIRNLDYDPKPGYAPLAERFAQANRLDRSGEQGVITGLSILIVTQGGRIVSVEGVTNRVYATTISGTGKLNKINIGDSSFTDACTTAHTVLKSWCDSRSIPYNKFDVNLSFGNSGIRLQGNSAGAAFATCMISAVGNYYIDTSAAVTGAIALNGSITGVGGVHEKAIAALLDRSVSLLAIPARDINQLFKVLLDAPHLYMAHQIIAISHINDLTRQVLLQRDVTGRLVSIDPRVNQSRELIIQGMKHYQNLRFTEANAALSRARDLCPEDLVTGLWIDLIKQDYQRIKREKDDY